MAKRILTGLRLDKIAAVDRPCQEHATMTIMKRADSPDAGNGITPAGPAGDLVDKKETPMSDEAKKVADLEKSVADLTKSLADSTSALALAETMAKMSDKDKAHLESLKDDEAKKAFVAMSADDRAKAIAKVAVDDEVLKVDNNEIRKSVVGAEMFSFVKSQQAAIAKQAEDLAKAEDARVMSDLRKRADDQYPHVPGTTDERASMLKAIADIKDEKVRKSFEAVLTQSEALAKMAFDTLGSRADPGIAKKAEDFEKKVAEYEQGGKVSKTEALRKARAADPEGFKAYQGETA